MMVFPAIRGMLSPEPPALPGSGGLEEKEAVTVEGNPAGAGPACFYAPQRRATTECGQCGAWVSEAWTARWGQRVYCVPCLEHLRRQPGALDFSDRVVLWDSVALVLALVPYTGVLVFLGVVTSPVALFLVVRHWKTPRSLVHRGRWRLWVAGLAAFLMLGFWVLVGVAGVVGVGSLLKRAG